MEVVAEGNSIPEAVAIERSSADVVIVDANLLEGSRGPRRIVELTHCVLDCQSDPADIQRRRGENSADSVRCRGARLRFEGRRAGPSCWRQCATFIMVKVTCLPYSRPQ